MTQEINRAFHEAAGKCWHKRDWDRVGEILDTCVKSLPCKKCGVEISMNYIDPNYADDPRLVIEVMMERKDWIKFLQYITNHCLSGYAAINNFTRDLIMDRTGKLRDLALEWINKQKGKSDEK